MHGQFTTIQAVSVGALGTIVVLLGALGATDVLRQPRWAWKKAERSRLLFLVVTVGLPLVGLALYIFLARPKVAPISHAGLGSVLPLDGVGSPTRTSATASTRHVVTAGEHSHSVAYTAFGAVSPPVAYTAFGAVSPPVAYTAFGAMSPPVMPSRPAVDLSELPSPSPFPGAGDTGTGWAPRGRPDGHPGREAGTDPAVVPSGAAVRTPSGPARPSRPQPKVVMQQLHASPPVTAPRGGDRKPTAPPGWKADPAGRHQFRYWDGFRWTDSVADSGSRSTDPVRL
ncbi:MAG: DUF2510 domain-containing protein [Actinomycetota bacterium]|nr:DUF2510 domain-containing protein [Actinomycetota bacterium]